MSKTNGYHQYFSPDQIAKYLEEGEFRIPGWRGNAYCDEELTTIELTKPTSESWVAVEPITKMGDSLNGQVKFTVYRWYRPGEEMDYWYGEHEQGTEMFFVYHTNDFYTIISCMGGHPAIETPTLSWGNSDGNTDTYIPSPFDAEMAIDLVYKLAVDFVENQCH